MGGTFLLKCLLTITLMSFQMACRSNETARADAAQADLILFNGPIYTVDPSFPFVEAVAVRKGRILAVGKTTDIFARKNRDTEIINLNGCTLLPGIIDSHIHFIEMGRFQEEADLSGAKSLDEMVERVGAKLTETLPGKWIRGRGWDQNKWENKAFPDHRALSRAIPDHPVILDRVDGHAVLANEKAMTLCGISAATPDTSGGRILRFLENGEPTGVFLDNAASLIRKHIPEPDENDYRRYIRTGATRCLAAGLTTVHDPGEPGEAIEVLKRMMMDKEIPIRIYLMLEGTDPVVDQYFSSGPEIGLYDQHLTVRCVKLYADGALGSRGAALLSPYSDDSGNTGIVVTGEDDLYRISKRAMERGFQVAVHAIGDRANRIVLNAFERQPENIRTRDIRPRIEHAQVLSSDDFLRFRKLGVIASMQPVHCTSDMYWAGERLGPEREKGAYAWRSLLDLGVPIAYGTDAPVESENPLMGFYAAVTRQDPSGWPDGGWHPEQVMTREEALKTMTIAAAHAGFEEKIKGSVTPGKLADFVILSSDIMKVPAPEILKTKIVATLIGGRIEYEIPGFLKGAFPKNQ